MDKGGGDDVDKPTTFNGCCGVRRSKCSGRCCGVRRSKCSGRSLGEEAA